MLNKSIKEVIVTNRTKAYKDIYVRVGNSFRKSYEKKLISEDTMECIIHEVKLLIHSKWYRDGLEIQDELDIKIV